jgi:hypothetical protein
LKEARVESQDKYNAFDNINSGVEFDPKKIEEQQQKLEAEYNKRDYLIHRVFAQNEEGQELLKYWMDSCIIKKPVLIKGESHDPYDIGIMQGIQDFVRGIYLTCKKVEGET